MDLSVLVFIFSQKQERGNPFEKTLLDRFEAAAHFKNILVKLCPVKPRQKYSLKMVQPISS